MNRRKTPLTVEKGIERMAALCARAEHCESEIRDKLRRAGMGGADVERVIDYLVEHHFIDDARYARAFTSDRVRFSEYGRNKILMALIAKHIDSHLIAEALDTIDHDQYAEVLLKATRQRARALDLDDYDQRAKLYRRLVSRGYESPLVLSAIRQVRQEQNQDPREE